MVSAVRARAQGVAELAYHIRSNEERISHVGIEPDRKGRPNFRPATINDGIGKRSHYSIVRNVKKVAHEVDLQRRSVGLASLITCSFAPHLPTKTKAPGRPPNKNATTPIEVPSEGHPVTVPGTGDPGARISSNCPQVDMSYQFA
jgi:hypothetical protein